MTDMFIPKRERLLIVVETIAYILLIVLASYFTICGDMFIRMVPMLYFLGIFGCIMFNKPIVTALLGAVSIFTFGCLTESDINLNIILFSVYAATMILFGETTGYILNLLYENAKLRKFIKYYHKIVYIIGLIVLILIPLFLNNLVNSNMISYLVARKNIDNYMNENYVYTECFVKEIKYLPSYSGGIYEFTVIVDDTEIQLNYNNNGEIADINLNNRKTNLNKMINAEINILLKKNSLTNLNVECRYDYSKVSTMPDIIRMSIGNVTISQIEDVLQFIEVIKKWDRFDEIDRIDISIDNNNVSISKKDLSEKTITEAYILNGMKQELLDNKEGM